MSLVKGKKGLIMGVANERSIAWGISQKLADAGAELAFTYLGDALKKRVIPLAKSLNSDFTLSCNVENNIYIFVMNAIYILIWTIILDSLCKNGYKELSWLLVLFPFILFFILLLMFLFN